jgi:membrane protein DedA with SNARE-associated domain
MTSVIARFGVVGVFLLMVPESACIPVPSEVTLLFSGFAAHRG